MPAVSLETHGSGLQSPKAVAAKLHSPNMEHTGPCPNLVVLRGQVSVTAHIPLGIRLSKEMLLPEQLEGPAKQRQAAKSAESQTPVHIPYSQISLYTATPASHRAEGAGRLDSPAPTINVLPRTGKGLRASALSSSDPRSGAPRSPVDSRPLGRSQAP